MPLRRCQGVVNSSTSPWWRPPDLHRDVEPTHPAPDPPPDKAFTGPNGEVVQVRYRLWLTAAGIVAEAEDAERGEGYQFRLMGPHDSRVDSLLEALRARIRRSLSHPDRLEDSVLEHP